MASYSFKDRKILQGDVAINVSNSNDVSLGDIAKSKLTTGCQIGHVYTDLVRLFIKNLTSFCL